MTKLLGLEPDPRFASFLGSGAARVVLPIRRKYEAAFEAFLNTGVTPTTDEQLDVGGPLLGLSRSPSCEEQERPSDDRRPRVGDPWEFRIASDLVRARRDDLLPKWTLTGSATRSRRPDTNS